MVVSMTSLIWKLLDAPLDEQAVVEAIWLKNDKYYRKKSYNCQVIGFTSGRTPPAPITVDVRFKNYSTKYVQITPITALRFRLDS